MARERKGENEAHEPRRFRTWEKGRKYFARLDFLPGTHFQDDKSELKFALDVLDEESRSAPLYWREGDTLRFVDGVVREERRLGS